MMQNAGKTTFAEKIGYGMAATGDSIAYGFIGMFLLFFLTTVADIPPAIAGTVIAVGSIWDAVYNPVLGYCADKIRSRFGRRRVVMLVFSIPLVIVIFLLFTNINMPMSVKPVYYGFMTVMFWTCYTGFFVPYTALGADYTDDYEDRTVLRSYAAVFNMIGNMMSMVAPTMMVEFFEMRGLANEDAWSATAAVLAVSTSAAILITIAVSKNKDLTDTEEKSKARIDKKLFFDLIKEYISVARLEPMRYAFAISLLALITYAIIMSDMVYYFTYNKGLTAVEISGCLLLRCVLGIVLVPAVNKVALITDKRIALIWAYAIGAAGLVFSRFVHITDTSDIMLYMLFSTLCTAIYWQVMPAMFYDICEYDRITTGKKREATIVSFQGLVEAIAAGLGGQILGIVLQLAGFDGESEIQTATAESWIENAATLLPVAVLLIAVLILYKYPLNKEKYKELTKNVR